jgi:hypothetical protein
MGHGSPVQLLLLRQLFFAQVTVSFQALGYSHEPG